MRVVLADDSALIREGLQLILEDGGHQVLAAVQDGAALVEQALKHRPDVCITDVRMPPSHTDEGLKAAIELRSQWPGANIVVLSQYVELSYAQELLNAGGGGSGYLLKDRVSHVGAFFAALDAVANGGTSLDPLVVTQLLNRRSDPLESLTPREREVLAFMAQGLTNIAIAKEMTVTLGAVEKYIPRVFSKLGLSADEDSHRRVQAVLAFLQHAGE